jgi:hypothetical protein
MKHLCASTIAFLLGLFMLASSARSADRAQLDAVSVHLFLEKLGTFSSDITSIPNFYSWNMVPSGGGIPKDEKFGSVLNKLRFNSPAEVFAKGMQARIVVMSSKDKKIIKTETFKDLYIGPGRIGYRALFVQNVSCTLLDILVTSPGKRIRKVVNFNCGE